MTTSSKKLYYLGQPSDGYGWGVANTNLVRELSKLCEVVVDTSNRTKFDAPVFVPISDSSLNPLRRVKRAPKVMGYCFTEWPLTEDAARNARQYDLIFAGSTWNTHKLKQAGINHVETLIQGVDFERFKPLPPSDRKGFVVFSGGKYEFRKGQDYVLRAMRHFMGHRKDAVLIAAWHNPWPQTMASMKSSWLIDHEKPFEGLLESRVIKVPAIRNEQTPEVYRMAHVGLFPNRCEAGTNLVMSEFMACARPVIATYAHGHKDVLKQTSEKTWIDCPDCEDGVDSGGEYCPTCGGDQIIQDEINPQPGPLLLDGGSYDSAGWFNTNVSDIIHQLEYAYQHRDELIQRGQQCRKLAEKLSWEDCARKVYEKAFQ